jgi:nitrite reductase/ring-hydroxylating ferredoxin subunit
MVYIDENELKEGLMKLVNIAGKNILLAKHNGELFGVSNQCPHVGCSYECKIENRKIHVRILNEVQ